MPWKTYKEGDKYVVRKLKPDGKPGELVASHDSESDAEAQVKALYASEKPQESAQVRTGYFAELAELSEAELSADGGVARVTLIRPGWSANSRYYSKRVISEAAKLFEGGQAYADHPGKNEKKERPERSVRDLVGYYNNIKVETDGRLTGDLHIVQDWLRPIVKASVTENAKLAGLSINALGETSYGEAEGKKGVIVEAIVKHNSTDVVTTPAAGGKFESLLMSDGDSWTHDLLAAMPLEELKETLRDTRPDLITAYQKEWKTPRDDKAVSAVRAENDKLKAQLAEAEKKYRTAEKARKATAKELAETKRIQAVDRLISESKLPKEWKDDIRTQLIEAKDHEAMIAILDRELAKAGKRPAPAPVKVKGSGASVSPAIQRGLKYNPIAESMGTDSRLMQATSIDEFRKLKQLTEA